MNDLIREKARNIREPERMGSYKEDDCIFLLKNINNLIEEQGNEEREGYMVSGVHYSEMLPIEYNPTKEYIDLFFKSLEENSESIAKYIAYVSELILKERGDDVILVSLARAGTPIGVLIKRYLKTKHNINAPHYSVSIIRGKGLDENAICYIVNHHQSDNIQFVDGWTGKGAVNNELLKSVEKFNKKYNTNISSELAVLADPSHSVSMCGTREDFLIPSACLNSTISGLMSRTVERTDIISEFDFHGAKYYDHLQESDLSNLYLEEICKHFNIEYCFKTIEKDEVLNLGIKEVEKIKSIFGIKDINKIKPGIGETTRVLLRRVPWKILIDDFNNPKLKHILLLAKDRNVPVEEFKGMTYSCIGLIKEIH